MNDRPPVPQWDGSPPPEAWEVARDPDWISDRHIVGDVATRQGCRFPVDGRHQHGAPIVAVLERGSSRRLYGYCGEHLYGRWFEDGVIVSWRVRKDWSSGR